MLVPSLADDASSELGIRVGGLEELDWIAGWVLGNDLPTADRSVGHRRTATRAASGALSTSRKSPRLSIANVDAGCSTSVNASRSQ
jgi:hypothetical protein